MSINVNDVGKIILVNAGYDLSGNSDLNLVFTKSDASTVIKTSADGVTAPTTSETVTLDGEEVTFNANEYFRYSSETGLFSIKGSWSVQGIYIEGSTKNLAGDKAEFSVFDRS